MELEPIRIFVKVIETGSFTKAAGILRLPKSTVSRAVLRLEEQSGTKLLLRTTRHLKLTASGKAFYESCAGSIRSLEDARKSLQGQDSIISGVVRITAPEDLGSFVISTAIGKLIKEHPALSIEFKYSDEVIDLIQDGYDLAVRIGKLNTSRFKAKKLGEIFLVAVAAPAYLKTRRKIEDPRDLSHHDCLGYRPHSAVPRWTLKSKGGTFHFPVVAKVYGNQMTSLVNMSIHGAGIAFVPHYLCCDALKSGKLTRVLPDWTSPGLNVSLVSPISTSSSARVKIVSERVSSVVSQTLIEP